MRRINIIGYVTFQVDQILEITDEEYNKFITPLEEDMETLTFETEDFLITRIDHENVEDVFFDVTELNILE